MSWKMLLVVAALAVAAVGCKTLSTDGQQPNKPAVTEETKADPAAVGDPADPARATEEGKATDENKAAGETKTEETKPEENKPVEPAPEGTSADSE